MSEEFEDEDVINYDNDLEYSTGIEGDVDEHARVPMVHSCMLEIVAKLSTKHDNGHDIYMDEGRDIFFNDEVMHIDRYIGLEVTLLHVDEDEKFVESSDYVDIAGSFESCGEKLRGANKMKYDVNQYECVLEFFIDAPHLLDLIMELFPSNEDNTHVEHNEYPFESVLFSLTH